MAPPPALVAPEGDVSEKVLGALVRMGFKRAEARRAVEHVRLGGVEPLLEPMLRGALTCAHSVRRFVHTPGGAHGGMPIT